MTFHLFTLTSEDKTNIRSANSPYQTNRLRKPTVGTAKMDVIPSQRTVLRPPKLTEINGRSSNYLSCHKLVYLVAKVLRWHSICHVRLREYLGFEDQTITGKEEGSDRYS